MTLKCVEALKTALDKNKVFFLYGEEQFCINSLLDCINTTYDRYDMVRYEGSTMNLKTLYGDIRQQSFFSPQRVFVINNLQEFKSIEKPENIEEFDKILKAIGDTNKMFFVYRKKLLRTSGLINLFARYYMYESKALTESQTIVYIENICKEQDIKMLPETQEMIYALLGNDMQKITSALVGLQGLFIDSDYLLRHVAYDKTFNAFELMAAIAKKNTKSIQLMTTPLLERFSPSEIIPLLGLLYSFFTKVLLLKTSSGHGINSALYNIAARIYSVDDILENISFLRLCDEQIKGL